MSELLDSLWVEKYRPQSLSEYLGNDIIKQTMELYIEKQSIPHLMLFGPAGTGKTTLARIMSKRIDCDVMNINASDENGIDTIRDKIKGFASGAGFRPLKIIILDEADFLTPNAQSVLRNTLEAYSVHTRFIFTCNYHEKIIAPINSRCQAFEVKPPSQKDTAIHLATILQKEKVEFTTEDIQFIVNTYYPDVRKMINFAQQSNLNGTLKICKENALDSDVCQKLIELLKTPKRKETFNDIRQLLADSDDDFDTLYQYLFKEVGNFANGLEALVIAELAESIYQSALVIPKARDILFLACIYRIIKHLK